MLTFDNVTRNYGDKLAVDQLNLSIPSGELFALLGPNGAGKTTTIRMLVGLLRPTSGAIRVNDFDVVERTRDSNHLLGYVPDEPYLYDKLTGREVLRFIADMYGMEARVATACIDREIERFGLTDFIDNLTESYSHGMKQRTVFASAMIHDPAVLVVDEPMVGLDPQSVRLVKDLLRDRAAAGTTVFMSTHTLAVAEEIADRIGIFNHGQMVFLGTLAELREQLAMQDQSLESLYLELVTDKEPPTGHTELSTSNATTDEPSTG